MDKGNKLKGSWRLTKEGGIVCMWKGKKEEEEKCEEDWLLVLMCVRIKHRRMCARIKHRKRVCKN